MSEWQPIETAPKDGTWVVLTNASVRDAYIAASWTEDGHGDYRWHTCDGDYHRDLPTHWMPLPAQPAIEKEAKRA